MNEPLKSDASSDQPSRGTKESVGTESSAGLSRRGFLGGVGTVAAALATSAVPTLERTADAAEVGPEIGSARLNSAYQKRIDAADRMLAVGMPAHPCNGDETLYANRIGNYSKGLPHNALGEVNAAAYAAWLTALTSGDPADFEAIPLGGARKLTNPQAGLAFDTEGNDPHQFVQPPAPTLASAEEAGEMVELYWMALLRDTHFDRYENSALAEAAAKELSDLSDFRGPKQGGQVTLQTLFRDDLPGCTEGPYLSQFMLKPTPFGAEFVERRMWTLRPGSDHGTSFSDWLAIQNGNVPGTAQFANQRRYIRNGRDLSEWVHIDVLFQAYFNACLILGTPPDNSDTRGGIGCPVNPGNPYNASATQIGFGTWGPPGIKAVLCEVASRALKAVWFQKWFVHRRLRPEEFGGRVHVRKSGLAAYPLHPEVLQSEVVDRVRSKYGTYLLPLAFPEGSPTHPAYGAGHATVAGACVTILKAYFDESFVIPNPVVINGGGTQLQPYNGGSLTVGGELNKLASNVATGRNIAGVHWRTDALESLRLGEQIAIAVLQDHKAGFNEVGSFQFTDFAGNPVVI
ncbi:MAG: vanadium-dependent haloperoxidase [Thermoanaerobaculia bacterium]|nr:vanadium-dependent haloperoxidase [Thermoanaerobaculia bacterium]